MVSRGSHTRRPEDRQRSALLPLRSGEHWHAFEGYAEHQYFVDPCKLLLTTGH